MPLRAGRGIESSVRRRASALVRTLDARPPIGVAEFCDRLAEQRGRPIDLVPHAFPSPSTVGLWVGTTDVDVLLFEKHTTRVHQQHIVLHEVGHVVLDHGRDVDDDDIWRALVPSLPPAVVRRALRRSAYDSIAECEAELFASILSDCVSLPVPRPRPVPSRSRLELAMDDPFGCL